MIATYDIVEKHPSRSSNLIPNKPSVSSSIATHPMSHQDYPPPGYGSVYPPPQQPGYPPAPPPQYMGYQYPDPSGPGTGYTYPPHPPPYQGYFNQNCPPPQPPYQVYHCEHHDYQEQDGCSSFFRGCMAALCFCCVLEECFG